MICPPDCQHETLSHVRQSAAGPLHCTPVTSVYSALLIAGPRSRRVLSKLTSANVSDDALPNGSSTQASLAQTHAVLLRQDLKMLPAFLILVSREYGECVWEAILRAGREFHLAPFGWEAHRRLMA